MMPLYSRASAPRCSARGDFGTMSFARRWSRLSVSGARRPGSRQYATASGSARLGLVVGRRFSGSARRTNYGSTFEALWGFPE